MKQGKFTTLLTATISPKDVGKEFQRRDPEVRLRDYQFSLEYWLKHPFPGLGAIVFAENSNYDLSSLAQIVREKNPHDIAVELLSFDEPGPPQGLNYGYSEFKLIRMAHEKSRYLTNSPYFIKATGRYIFPDLPRLIRRLPEEFKVAAEARGARPFSPHNTLIIQFALAIFETEFFRDQLWNVPETMTPAPPWTRNQFIESVLFDRLYPMRHEPGMVLRWPCNCEPSGIGANGDNYTAPKKRLQSTVRALGRRFCPSLWF